MQKKLATPTRRFGVITLMVCMLVLTYNAWGEVKRSDELPKDAGWSLAFENDLLAGGAEDKDFTYGLNASHQGERSLGWFFSPANLHQRIDALFGLREPSEEPSLQGNSFELGLYGFTPEDISQESVIEDDRPYASMVYTASTHNILNVAKQSAVSTSLTFGVLGLDLVGSLQNNLHESLGGDRAQGWDKQIAHGGEPTFRYSVAKQSLWQSDAVGVESKSTVQLSLGYISEASYSLAFRKGKINSQWWTFSPELALYGERTSPTAANESESFVWGGVAVKARAHNSFLQGQFRESEHAYSHDELNHFLIEAWAGYTVSFADSYRFSYLLRSHSSEIKDGAGNRSLVWGGVVLSRDLN